MGRFRVGPEELRATAADARGLAQRLEQQRVSAGDAAGHPAVADALTALGDEVARQSEGVSEVLEALARAVDAAAAQYVTTDHQAADGAARIQIRSGRLTQ